ncbi:hypothetical protein ABTB90_19225, partial [Acinetobacter baumannii]
LKYLCVDRSDISDKQLMKLPDFPQLEHFTCFLNPEIDGSCLARLSKYPKLRYVSMWDTRPTWSNLKYLKDMHNLEGLNLSDTNMKT